MSEFIATPKEYRQIQNEVGQALGIPTGSARQEFDCLTDEQKEQVFEYCQDEHPTARQKIRNIVVEARAQRLKAERDRQDAEPEQDAGKVSPETTPKRKSATKKATKKKAAKKASKKSAG